MNLHEKLLGLGVVVTGALIGAILGDQVFQKKLAWPQTKRVKGGA